MNFGTQKVCYVLFTRIQMLQLFCQNGERLPMLRIFLAFWKKFIVKQKGTLEKRKTEVEVRSKFSLVLSLNEFLYFDGH